MNYCNSNSSFTAFSFDSNQKRNNLRKQSRQRHITEIFQKKREKYADSIQIINQKHLNEQVQAIINEFKVAQIIRLSKILLENQNLELSEKQILVLIRNYEKYVGEQITNQQNLKSQKNQDLIFDTPSKNHLKNAIKNKGSHSGTSHSRHLQEQIQQITPIIFLFKLLYILINQTSKNSWTDIPFQTNEKIIKLCLNVLKQSLALFGIPNIKGSTPQILEDRVKNIILMSIIVMGNLCVDDEHVRILLEGDIIQILVDELWKILQHDHYEDLSFLVANMLYNVPAFNFKDNKKSLETIQKEWNQLLYLYKFLCEQFFKDISNTNEYQSDSFQQQKKSPLKLIKFRHKNEYSRYYRHDLMESIIKIRYLVLKFYEQVYNLERQEIQLQIFAERLTKQLQNQDYYETELICQTCQAAAKLSGKLQRMKILRKQNNYKYLPGESMYLNSQREYIECIVEVADMLRFMRDLMRMDTTKINIQHNFIGLQFYNANKNGFTFIYKLISFHHNETIQQEQIKLNEYCWSIIELILSISFPLLFKLKQLGRSNAEAINKFAKILQMVEGCLEWLQQICMKTLQTQKIEDNQESRATSIFFKFYPMKFQLNLARNKRLQSLHDDVILLKIEFVAHFIPIAQSKMQRYLHEDNHIFIFIILQSFHKILIKLTQAEVYQPKSKPKAKGERRSSALDQIIEQTKNINNNKQLNNSLEFKRFLSETFQKYNYMQKIKDQNQYISEIKDLLIEILYGKQQQEIDQKQF